MSFSGNFAAQRFGTFATQSAAQRTMPGLAAGSTMLTVLSTK
jgi:hypothetical protein